MKDRAYFLDLLNTAPEGWQSTGQKLRREKAQALVEELFASEEETGKWQEAFEKAESLKEKNVWAACLREKAQEAQEALSLLVRSAGKLTGFAGNDALRSAAAEAALRLDYLINRTWAPWIGAEDVEKAVRALGVKRGDILLTHSSYGSLGNVWGGAQAVIDGLRAVVGEEGTLAFPTLVQKDFPNAYRDWHIDRPADTGYLVEFFRKLPGVLRSDQATHSVAAQGPLAWELTYEHCARGMRLGAYGSYAFGGSSPWQKMYDRGAKVLFIGTGLESNTFKHFLEYRLVEKALKEMTEEKRQRARASLRVFDTYYSLPDEEKAQKIWPYISNLKCREELDARHMIAHGVCGNASLMCIEVHPMVDTLSEVSVQDKVAWFGERSAMWFQGEV